MTSKHTKADLERQLERANRIIGWMMPYIGRMCTPSDGLYDLNLHCFENHVPESGVASKGPPIQQRVNTGMVP